jgi:hypothetical protein
MSDEPTSQPPPAEPEPAAPAAVVRAESGSFAGLGIPVMGEVVAKSRRFSREVIATMIALASAAFGVVAALAWNSAITEAFKVWFPPGKNVPHLTALFVYAIIVTLIGVVVIVMLGRLAGRLNATPLEFKYPAAPKS